MASFPPKHSRLLVPGLFLVILAVFVSSAASEQRTRVLEEEQDVLYPAQDWELPTRYQNLCINTREHRPCRRVLATIPEVKFLLPEGQFAELLPHVIANRSAEAMALAIPLLATAAVKGGEPPKCLAACTTSLIEVSKVMSGLPAKTELDPARYLKVQSFLRKLFKPGAVPPLCKSGCPDKTSSADEIAIANKFHAIWALMDCAETFAYNYDAPSPPPPQR